MSKILLPSGIPGGASPRRLELPLRGFASAAFAVALQLQTLLEIRVQAGFGGIGGGVGSFIFFDFL